VRMSYRPAARGCAFRWRAPNALSDDTDVKRIRIAGSARAWWGLAIGAGLVLAVILFVVGVTAPLAWTVGVVTAVVTGVIQGRMERAFPPGRPLTVTVALDVGNYVRIPQGAGSRVAPRSGLNVEIVVETSEAQAVILHEMRAVVVSRTPVAGARPVAHMGVMDVRRFEIWLNDEPPRIAPTGWSGFPYKVTNSDPEIISVTAHVRDALIMWRLELVWSCNGRKGVLPVDLQGHPFVTAGLADD
jgi:hypothetical protein